MAIMQLYSKFLHKHPIKVLALTASSVVLVFTITVFLHPLNSFNDPLIGFEARGTEISARLNTWKLLNDETTASANNISLVPNWSRYDAGYHNPSWHDLIPNQANLGEEVANNSIEPEPPIIESSIQQTGAVLNKTLIDATMDEGEIEYYKQINSSHKTEPPMIHYSLGSSKAFCGKLYEGYAQAIVSPTTTYQNQGLFNLNSLLSICQLDRKLRLESSPHDAYLFIRECEQYHEKNSESSGLPTCCNSWSLPNYVACLNNKPSCMYLDSNDLKMTEHLLDLCTPHYLNSPYEECFNPEPEEYHTVHKPQVNFFNPPDINSKSHCGQIPGECLKCGGWVYNVLHYLTSENFLKHPQPNLVPNVDLKSRQQHRLTSLTTKDSNHKLAYTSIFLPIAKSSSLMKYYLALSKQNLITPFAQVKVLNLGLKNSLFEHLISSDVKLFLIALMAILLVISIYTWSLILSLVILLIICLSLCLSYSIYELVFNISIFPFMNLLAVVISFGICSDNAMLFCKHWSSSEHDSSDQPKSSNNESVQQSPQAKDLLVLERMLRKSVMSTSAATLATACSFVISAISQVTAVRCFCIFATLCVITNYILTVLLLPPALLIDSKLQSYISQSLRKKNERMRKLSDKVARLRSFLLVIGDEVHINWIYFIITKFKYYLIITFVALLLCSALLVFHGPGLRPAEDDEIQLFTRRHAFEQYDKNLKHQFAFERAKLGELFGSRMKLFQENQETLPIRIVFGLKPRDNGNFFDPQSRGTLEFDTRFDIADPKAQTWMLDFCRRLRNQRFIRPPSITEQSNCFMDTFKSWMETRACRDPVHPDVNLSPCCQSYEFPYDRYTFNKCMLEAINIMRRSPHLHPNVNAGIRFFKNSSRVAALIVEFQSNRLYTESFSKMEMFYNDIDEWVSWHVNNTAPPGLKSGWFISSNLDLLALQTELDQSTNTSIHLEIAFATIALLISTRDAFLTFAGTLTIGTIIVVILAALVLLKWTLGVAESILISLTIGLSIDFALHYTVAYSEGLSSRLSHGVIQRILREVGSPITLAATTTSLAGFVIFWSDILAYQELGTFLMLIALTSWISSTLFLLPMLATFDSIKEFNEQYSRMIVYRARKLIIDRMAAIS